MLGIMQFLTHSMDKLASALQPHQFKHLREHVSGRGNTKFILEAATEKKSASKRKRKGSKCKGKTLKRARCDFIDDEASGDGSSEEEEISDEMDDGFIDDEHSGDEPSFYHQIDSLETNNTAEGVHEDEADEEKIALLSRKGVFCYDYFNSPDRLSEPALPSKDKFFNNLYQSDISKEDYQNALTVWEKFECKTFADYLRIYNKSDVLILADVFENF